MLSTQTNQNILAKPASAHEAPPLVMALLRTETAVAHKQLEKTLPFARLFSPDYTLAEYRDLLCRFYGFVSVIEPLIFGGLADEHQFALGHRTKTALLAHDLTAFGINDISSLPQCGNLTWLETFANRMGALYVMEGSALGGQVISKRLQAHFGEIIDNKLNYYQCYGDNTGTEWRSFQRFMGEQFDDSSQNIPEVVDAANATFTALYEWFEKA